MTRRGVVLLFGTFNPFTNAHLKIGRLAKEKYPDYDIYYVPAKDSFMSSYKQLDAGNIMSENDRYELIEGSIKDIPGFFVTDIEYTGIVNGKTINTVKYFKEQLGYSDAVLCFGTDKVPELEYWYKGRELVSENKFLIVTREGKTLSDVMTEYTNQHRQNFTEISNSDFSNISGTGVRNALATGDYDYLKQAVPDYVYSKIVRG